LLTAGLVSAQTSAPAANSGAISNKGRLYVELSGTVVTGGAFANASAQSATVSYFFTDAAGRNSGESSFVIPPNGHVATLFNQLSPAAPSSGSFTYNATAPLSVTGIRVFTNETGFFLGTIIPVAPITPSSETVIIPHWADGGGYSVKVGLVNNTNRTSEGVVQFLLSTGEAATLTVNGVTGTSFPYSIAPRSSITLMSAGAAGSLQIGSVRVSPSASGSSPSAFDIITYKAGGVSQMEFAVPGSR
jgi:hypothetical protein